MSDLIERQAAVDYWRHIIDATSTDDRYNTGFVNGLEFCISHLSTMPPAQPERKMGHWEDVPHKSVEHGEVVADGKTVRCSVCRHAEKGWNKGMNYCPECGAKMETEGNEG